MLRIDNQIIQLTVDTGIPVSFLNWATAKEIMVKSSKVRFIPSFDFAYKICGLQQTINQCIGGTEDEPSVGRLGGEMCYIPCDRT